MAATRSSSARPKLVVIDDSRTVLATLRVALQQAGFEVQTACDPGEISPDDAQSAAAVVVDVQMEHVYGDDVVSFLRGAWQVSVPIFLFSSLPIEELVVRAQAAGASGAVCKTSGVPALIAELKKALERT
jgi:two-component system alkaline phosphatase synthesis response regulator PhoP